MGTPLFTAFRVYEALQQISAPLGRLFRSQQRRTAGRAVVLSTPNAVASAAAVPVPGRVRARPPRRLRGVRVLEGSQAAASAGRMVISGRMADVCAELERLAALEAAAG